MVVVLVLREFEFVINGRKYIWEFIEFDVCGRVSNFKNLCL